MAMLAEPTITVTLAETPWDIQVTVYVEIAATPRLAQEGEIQLQLVDIGEGINYNIYNNTGWIGTDANGIVAFSNAIYPWIVGFESAFGSNRYWIRARLAGAATWKQPEFFLSDIDYAPKVLDPPLSMNGQSERPLLSMARERPLIKTLLSRKRLLPLLR